MELNKTEMVLAGIDETVLAGLSGEELALEGVRAANSPGSKERKLFLERINAFPDWVKKRLADKTYQVADITLFGMADLVAGTVKVFKTDDDIVDNVRNFSKARVPNERPMLLTHIEIQQSATNIAAGFDAAQYTAAFKKAEFKLAYEKFPIIDKELIGTFTGNNVNGYNTNKVYGEVELKNPKVLLDNKQIEFEILSSIATGAVLVALKGITVIPNSNVNKS